MKTKTKKSTLKIFKSHSDLEASLRGGEGDINSSNLGRVHFRIDRGAGYFYPKSTVLLVRFGDFRMQFRMDW